MEIWNTEKGTNGSYTANSGYFIVDSGLTSARTNCFRVTESNTYDKTYATSGDDYAEMFEWADGNINNENRAGKFVTLRNAKISLATSIDTYIIGVDSKHTSLIGDLYDDQWQGKFETDIFGNPICAKQEHILEEGAMFMTMYLK